MIFWTFLIAALLLSFLSAVKVFIPMSALDLLFIHNIFSYIDKALEIEDYLQYKLVVLHEGKNYSYSDFCGAQCETSDAVHIFLTMFRDVKHRGKTNVKLTYPTMDVFGHRVYLANNIYQVTVNNRSNIVEGCRLIAINFHAIYNNSTMEEIMKKWEHAALDYALSTKNDPLIRVFTTSEGLVSEEVRRTGKDLTGISQREREIRKAPKKISR